MRPVAWRSRRSRFRATTSIQHPLSSSLKQGQRRWEDAEKRNGEKTGDEKKVCRSREKVTCGSHSSFERGVSDQCRYSSGVFCLTEQVYTIQNHKSHWSHKTSSSLCQVLSHCRLPNSNVYRFSLCITIKTPTLPNFPPMLFSFCKSNISQLQLPMQQPFQYEQLPPQSQPSR